MSESRERLRNHRPLTQITNIYMPGVALSPLEALPAAILTDCIVAPYLTALDVTQLCATSSRLRAVLVDNALWAKFLLVDFGVAFTPGVTTPGTAAAEARGEHQKSSLFGQLDSKLKVGGGDAVGDADGVERGEAWACYVSLQRSLVSVAVPATDPPSFFAAGFHRYQPEGRDKKEQGRAKGSKRSCASSGAERPLKSPPPNPLISWTEKVRRRWAKGCAGCDN
jgi:hypothetical protein